jgi:type IV pilus assembly protein PilA
MENPYARPAASSAAPAAAPATPEAQKVADYEAVIGPNREYYLPKFEAFDAGGPLASWHWPAFFVTTPWYLYRKMWLWGMLNLAYPWIAAIVLGIALGISRPSITIMVIVSLIVLAVPSVLLAVFANALYWKHSHKVIRGLPNSIAAQPDKRQLRLERNGGTGVGPMIGVLAGGFFFGVFMIGMMAAISIPAYQDYSIRSQITEGLNLAAPLKAQVVEYYMKNSTWPEQVELDGEPPSGRYVSSVNVVSGSVMITYGIGANPKINGQRLALTPAIDMDGDVHWICGNGKVNPGERMADGPTGTDIPEKYLPRLCRTGGRPAG